MRSLVATALWLVIVSVNADVYQDRTLGEAEVTGLARLLKNSVAPGGVREISINGSRMQVVRRVTPGKRHNHGALDAVEQAFTRTSDRAGWEAAMRRHYASLDQMMLDEAPPDAITASADQIVSYERDAIIDELETPVRYRMGVWDVFSRIPIAAIDPDSPLARLPVSEGFIYMAELDAENSQGFWEIRFSDAFRLSDIMGKHRDDAPGFDPPVRRFPGSRRTLTYTEAANNWESNAWSFESRGGVSVNLNHYVREFEQLGYARGAISLKGGAESFIQLFRGNEEVRVYVVDTQRGGRPVQVTLQHSRYQ